MTRPGDEPRGGEADVFLIVASACAERGLWQAVWSADHLDRTLPVPLVLFAFMGVLFGALACWWLRPRWAAIGALGVVTFGCLMLRDQHPVLLGATLVNAGHHAFVPCILALFAERLEPDGPSLLRYSRVGAFLVLLELPLSLAPFLTSGQTLGSVHAICTLLAVSAMIGVAMVRAVPALARPMPVLVQSAYRGAAPKEAVRATPIADGLRLVAPLVIPAVVFAFIASAHPRELASADAAAVVRPIMIGSGASVFFLGTLRPSSSPLKPLSVFGVALFLAGGAWTLTNLPATWDYTDAGFMGVVSSMVPLATTYAVLAARDRAAIGVIAPWYALTALASYAGQSAPRRADWMGMVAIVLAALALVLGVWCVRNAARVHARFDGGRAEADEA
jgi:hypothetical protein